MNVPFLNLQWQHAQIKDSLKRRFEAIFETTSFVLGKDVELFEAHFAQYLGSTYAIGVGSGTDALVLALRALEVGPGDEVITVPTSFIASAAAIALVGARPVFADIDPSTRNFDLIQLEQVITKKTKAIMPVHLYGAAAPIEEVVALAKKYSLSVIEDACQAHGALVGEKKLGTYGTVGCFSFYPGKNLGAYGEGGAVVTDDEHIALTVKKLRNHGGIAKYEHEMVGYNSRLDTLQAAVLDEKLNYLDEWNDMRRVIAKRYDEAFATLPLDVLVPLPRSTPVYHLYVIELLEGDRERFTAHLREGGVGVGIHYPDPLHLVPALSTYGYKKGEYPQAERFTERIVSLPIFPGMREEEVAQVIQTVQDFFKK